MTVYSLGPGLAMFNRAVFAARKDMAATQGAALLPSYDVEAAAQQSPAGLDGSAEWPAEEQLV